MSQIDPIERAANAITEHIAKEAGWGFIDDQARKAHRKMAEVALAASGPLPPPPQEFDPAIAWQLDRETYTVGAAGPLPERGPGPDGKCDLGAMSARGQRALLGDASVGLSQLADDVLDLCVELQATRERGDVAEQLAEALRHYVGGCKYCGGEGVVFVPPKYEREPCRECAKAREALAAFSAPRTPQES